MYDDEYAAKLEAISGFNDEERNVGNYREVDGKKLLFTIDGDPVPENKVKEMQVYAKKLLKNSPKMKPDRLKRKVAEHFKIKLV